MYNYLSKNEILISIIVPVYNIEKYIERCLRSIIDQTFRNFEIIVVNDGSSDKSSSVCDDISSSDKRIHVVHKKNGGVTSARKLGVSIAKGDYIMFVDGDDAITKDCLEKLIDPILLNDYELVLGNYEMKPNGLKPEILSEGELTKENYLKQLLEGNVIWGPVCKLFKRKLFNTTECFAPDSIKRGEDAIMNINIALVLSSNVYIIKDVIYYYYLHGENTTSTQVVKFKSSKLFLDNMLLPLQNMHFGLGFDKSISVFKLKWWLFQIWNCESLPFPDKFVINLLTSINVDDVNYIRGVSDFFIKILKRSVWLTLVYSYILHLIVKIKR